ncbi:hypothetical protein F5X96DRAFT_617613 [Biscogniauxia mediterranea]|nr:hypothetical protein F5X96DRAFT_617613 [Biscogniauxia mediterranea]
MANLKRSYGEYRLSQRQTPLERSSSSDTSSYFEIPLYSGGVAGSETDKPFDDGYSSDDGSSSMAEADSDEESPGFDAPPDAGMPEPLEEQEEEAGVQLSRAEEAMLDEKLFGERIKSIALALSFIARVASEGVDVGDTEAVLSLVQRWRENRQSPSRIAESNHNAMVKHVLQASVVDAHVLARKSRLIRDKLEPFGIHF